MEHNPGGLAPILPVEFATRAREIAAELGPDSEQMRREWMHLAVVTLYSIGYGAGVEALDQALEAAR